MESGKNKIRQRVAEFTSERDERENILDDFSISYVDRTVMEGAERESGT